MINKCKCGTFTNLSRTCSKCSSPLDWTDEIEDLYEDLQPRRPRKRKKKIIEEIEED